jgi:hypothetical protein
MNYIIPQHKFKHVIFKYLDNKFNSFKKVYSKDYDNSVFYVLGEKIMAEYIIKQSALVLDWNLWSEIFDMFSFKFASELQEIVEEWVNNRFELEKSIVDFHDFDGDFYDL